MSAQKSLVIATPYLIPDSILENALILTALRGVKIKILLPRSADSRIVHTVSLVHAQKLLNYAEIHLYEGGFMHQKVMLIDDEVSVIGTSNFDNRSIYLTFETSVVIHDRSFSGRVGKMLDDDFSQSSRVEGDSLLATYARPFYRFIGLLGPLF